MCLCKPAPDFMFDIELGGAWLFRLDFRQQMCLTLRDWKSFCLLFYILKQALFLLCDYDCSNWGASKFWNLCQQDTSPKILVCIDCWVCDRFKAPPILLWAFSHFSLSLSFTPLNIAVTRIIGRFHFVLTLLVRLPNVCCHFDCCYVPPNAKEAYHVRSAYNEWQLCTLHESKDPFPAWFLCRRVTFVTYWVNPVPDFLSDSKSGW